jgi:hypothetical protein
MTGGWGTPRSVANPQRIQEVADAINAREKEDAKHCGADCICRDYDEENTDER